MAASAMIKSCWVSCVRYHYRPKLQDSQVGIKTRCNFHKIVVTRSDYAQETKRLIWFLTKFKFNKELLSDSRVKGTKPAYTGYFLIFFSIFWSFHHMVLCSTIWSADWEKMPLPTNLVAAVPENEMLLFCGGEHSKVKTRIKRKNIDTAV